MQEAKIVLKGDLTFLLGFPLSNLVVPVLPSLIY